MLEGTPFAPFDSSIQALSSVEKNMAERRAQASALLNKNEVLLSMTMFPLMGVQQYTQGEGADDAVQGPIANSLFVSDSVINPHPRFGTLTRNIRQRRNANVCIATPLYLDTKTDPTIGIKKPTAQECIKIDPAVAHSSPTHIYQLHNQSLQSENALPKLCVLKTPSIYMDAMAFGMGCCCLQCTFQCRDIDEARLLYDQLAVLCPIMLSASAATPIVRGLLADSDVYVCNYCNI